MPAADFRLFLERAFRACRGALKPGASVYVCHSSSWQREFQDALETAGFKPGDDVEIGGVAFELDPGAPLR